MLKVFSSGGNRSGCNDLEQVRAREHVAERLRRPSGLVRRYTAGEDLQPFQLRHHHAGQGPDERHPVVLRHGAWTRKEEQG